MDADTNKVIATQIAATVGTLITSFLGFFMVHYLATQKERRKELNELADSLYFRLYRERQRGQPSPSAVEISDEDFLKLERRMSSFKGLCFRRAWKKYQESRSEKKQFVTCPDDPTYHAPEEVVKAIDGLLPFVRRK